MGFGCAPLSLDCTQGPWWCSWNNYFLLWQQYCTLNREAASWGLLGLIQEFCPVADQTIIIKCLFLMKFTMSENTNQSVWTNLIELERFWTMYLIHIETNEIKKIWLNWLDCWCLLTLPIHCGSPYLNQTYQVQWSRGPTTCVLQLQVGG